MKGTMMSLSGYKSAFSSLTIRGAFVMVLPILFKLLGFDLGSDASGVINNLVEATMEFVGATMVVYGRIRATKTVTLLGP
jgi:hypothetical protein